MERVAFLVEKTGVRIPCMLNPESVVVRRTAGVQVKRFGGAALSRGVLADDPLYYSGGGTTEILLNLLFDTSLTDSAQQMEDVRAMTRALFELSQGSSSTPGEADLPLVRFVWGKAWNILGVVSAVSERLEYFTADGAPQRSWMRIRMLRVAEPEGKAEPLEEPVAPLNLWSAKLPGEESDFYSLPGEGMDGDSSTERLDQVAWTKYGKASWWKTVAAFNNIDDPLNLSPGTTLRLPPRDTA
jgi:Contractile injection system tube protein